MEMKINPNSIFSVEDLQDLVEYLIYLFPDISIGASNKKSDYISCENDGKEINT
jgi:hypothetical protein